MEGTFICEFHEGQISRSVSGSKRDALACSTVEFGAKNVQNQILLSRHLSPLNYKNEEICKSFGALRQMKYQKLAFGDLDTDDVRDLQMLKSLTDNLEPTPDDFTPSYISYIRADEFAVC